MKSNEKALIQRGYLSKEKIKDYSHLKLNQLIKLLQSEIPQERTIAATLLGQIRDDKMIDPLCEAIKKETKLYSKIAISEALGTQGSKSAKKLVILLGKIGKNQYKALPKKPFKKNNYPLPRDIIARTLTKIGVDALPFLMEILQNGSKTQISEAIDSIGYISYYSNDSSSLPCLWTCLEKYKDNKVIFWKIIRSFQSFQDDQVVIFLNYIKMNSKYQEIQWEAERSLKQIKFHNKK